MGKAVDEMSHWAEYDYIVVNDDLDKAVEQISAILTAASLKTSRLDHSQPLPALA